MMDIDDYHHPDDLRRPDETPEEYRQRMIEKVRQRLARINNRLPYNKQSSVAEDEERIAIMEESAP